MANQNLTQLTQQTTSADATSLFYAVTNNLNDTALPISVLVNNLGLTGVPTTPTASTGTNTTQIASTAFVQAAVSGGSYAGSFTTLSASSTVSGAGFSTYLASPPAIGGTVANTGAFSSLTDTGLTANSFVYSGTGSLLTSTSAPTNGQLLIGSTGVAPVAATLTGTANQVVVTNGAGSVTLSTPQSIATSSTPTFAGMTLTGALTPSTTAGIIGTTAADSANAGSVGELQTNTTNTTSLTTTVVANATSISLPAGDWDVWGNIHFAPAGTTTVAQIAGSISTTSATLGGASQGLFNLTLPFSTGVTQDMNTGVARINVSSTTTVYLVALASFGVSTMTCNGTIIARRRR